MVTEKKRLTICLCVCTRANTHGQNQLTMTLLEASSRIQSGNYLSLSEKGNR